MDDYQYARRSDLPSLAEHAPDPSYSQPFTTVPTIYDSGKLSAPARFPRSGRVLVRMEGYCWPNSGATFGEAGYFALMNGATVVGAAQAIWPGQREGRYSASFVIEGEPGSTVTLSAAIYASAAGAINMAADGTPAGGGKNALLLLTPVS